VINYPARRTYRDEDEATTYDADRFSGLRGRIGDYLDKLALKRAYAVPSGVSGSSGRVLDLPCGTGRIAQFFVQNGVCVTGADVSHEMLGVARTKLFACNGSPTFAQMDGVALGFKNDAFDCIMSVRFMGHIPEDARISILKEFRRVGRYAIIEYSIRSFATTLIKGLRRGRLFTSLPRRWGWTVFEREQLRDELARADLRIVSMYPKLRWFSDSWYVLVERGGGIARSSSK